ncbi:hypothetical protein ATANTOWER_019199 [Ataeniobius toweri]|uniref:Uncharacterized protein n=1 Tax=Ataeniobius toweri TaxID=208326 RepID=A0ABU7AZG1_9TELE|nr:hypothetical protein [Ataeniobius toweri]
MRPQDCGPRPQNCGSKNIKTHKIQKQRESEAPRLPSSAPSCGAYSSLPQSLQVAGVSACWCVGGSQCLGLGALVCAGSLPVAAWQGLGPLALSGLFWGVVHPCSGIDTHSALWLLGGPSGVPALWVAFGYLWLRSPACLSQVLGGRSVAPHVCY